MVKFLTPEQILSIQRKVEIEQNHMVNENSLYAICAKFLQGYYDETPLFEIATIYFRDVVEKHIFGNGNKRTAIIASILFLEMNGYRVKANQNELYDVILDFFQTRDTKNLENYLRAHSNERNFIPPSTQEFNYHLDRVIEDYSHLIVELAKT